MQAATDLLPMLAEYRHGDRILDAGCAGGHFFHTLRMLDPNGLRYLGIDLAASYLAAAPSDLRGNLVCADLTAIPLQNQAMTWTVCSNVLPHVPPDLFGPLLRELIRVTSKRVICRLFLAEQTYIVRVGGPTGPFHNLYSHADVQASLGDHISFKVVPHAMQPFDNRAVGGAALMSDGRQISGALLLNSVYLVIDAIPS
jgi:ubiquinone/menaquinone biosynthesis C-methylase UbiE